MIAAYVLLIDRNLSLNEYYTLSEMVSSNKREQVKRFARFEDAQRTLLGDVLIRRALKDRYGISNSEIVFEKNAFGKPFLKSHPEYHFNISHSKNYVVGAISETPVGIDVEAIGNMDMRIADRFYTLQEKQYILGYSNEERSRALYQIWTKKEAYIKRDGRGFQIPLNSINVLAPIENTFFHLIFGNKEALCHVCSCDFISPTIEQPAMDSIFE